MEEVLDALRRFDRFLLTSHERLDGDAVGSELALCRILRASGKRADIYNQDPTPANYRFLPGAGEILNVLPPVDQYEAAVVLDCSELERVGRESQRIGSIPCLVNIDHHLSNGGFCERTWIEPDASSTGELIFRLAERGGFALSPETANCLYTAILTDTGGFRYGNTGTESLRAASILVSCGASPQTISENVYESYPAQRFLLLGIALRSLSFDLGGKVGSLVVTLDALAAAGAVPEMTENFVDLPRSVKGVAVSILFSELSPNLFKVSLRSKGSFNVERVAAAFRGGGHINAAACRIEGDLETVRKSVLEVIREGRP
jgi:phosphoesterase RecJ-like protein